NYDEDEESWINESASEAAMVVNGYTTDEEFLPYFAEDPDQSLVETSYVNYGIMLLWGTYLYERFGIDFLHTLVSEEANGLAGLDQALADAGVGMTSWDLFLDWVVANRLDEPGIYDGIYGYASLDLPPFADSAVVSGDAARSVQGRVSPYAADYIRIEAIPSDTLHLSLSSPRTEDLGLRLIRLEGNAGQIVVEPIDPAEAEGGIEVTEIPPEATLVLVVAAKGRRDLSYTVDIGESGGVCAFLPLQGRKNAAILLFFFPTLLLLRRRRLSQI
ncbi:MAG: hypothetical protein D6812_09550, partial [Deltaproteobacteria bacterium]